jgi:hypothetical protein
MRETREHTVKLGFRRKPAQVLDEIEMLIARMKRNGWDFADSCIEDDLSLIHLFFERDCIPDNEI